jgi:pyridoxine 5-phosphate synthase
MVKLGVNIDHVATLRQARREGHPDPTTSALSCEKAGADGITAHLREDRRHIQDGDISALRMALGTKLNLEMAVSEDILRVALHIGPDDVCLVPEKREELTTEGGLDVIAGGERLKAVVARLKARGINVSLFIDPELKQVRASKAAGADCVELHTGSYARHFGTKKEKRELKRLKEAGALAVKLGLTLNAGHGLDYKNVAPVARIKGMNELNIGFSIIEKALETGLQKAVREMKKLIN